MSESAQVVVCGAGIAGVSTALHLVRLGVTDVVVADPRSPLTLTSDKSTECYRDWWPSSAMVGLMSRSIDLLERYSTESGNAFNLSRRGYLFLTSDRAKLADMARSAHSTAALGLGEVRSHGSAGGETGYVPAHLEGWKDSPEGVDLFMGGEALRRWFPEVGPSVVGGLHLRRAGWFSAQQLGMWMVDQASAAGVRFVGDEVVSVDTRGGKVCSVTLSEGESIDTITFVNAGGPLLDRVGAMVGTRLPVHSELHQKISFHDHLGAIPRGAPMVIWSDPQRLDWTPEEAAFLVESGRSDVIEELPRFCHGRPEGGEGANWALGLWEWKQNLRSPEWPLPEDPLYPELVLRGLSTMLPAVGGYSAALPRTRVDGGYYTKTPENLPLIGPVGPNGSFVCGALSGYGVMAACAAGELVAQHMTGAPLPAYEAAFRMERYAEPGYLKRATAGTETGQL